MTQIFAYVEYKEAVIADTTSELFKATQKIDPTAQVTAIVMGTGDTLNTVCNEVANIFPQVWKFDNAELAYPNAEIMQQILVKTLLADSIVLISHNSFGMDLAPGLSFCRNDFSVSHLTKRGHWRGLRSILISC